MVELDRATGEIVSRWTQESLQRVAAWWSVPLYRRETFSLSAWRACLRCGTVPGPTVTVCAHCYLSGCDCDD